MRAILRYSILCLTILTFHSCTDVVDLDVSSAPPELVVEGVLSDDQDLFVKLSETSAFFDNSGFNSISGARVSLLENGVEKVVLTESPIEAGTYLSDFKGSLGNIYQLRVEINANVPDQMLGTWVSSADTMKRVPTIDSMAQLRLDRNTNPQAFFEGQYAVMYFGDFDGRGDYYRLIRSLNDSVFAQEDFFINDENFDGFYLGAGGDFPALSVYGPFEDPEPGQEPDSLSVRLVSISKGFFDYMQVLLTQVQTGSPFDAPPALVLGNIHKENEPETYAFGYFQVNASSESGIRYAP